MKSSEKPTPKSATRIECYIPEVVDLQDYDIAFDWLCDEFAYAHGGCSSITGIAGQFVSASGLSMSDRITLVWCDLPWRWTTARERAEAIAYTAGLRDYLTAVLPHEEVIYVTLVPVFRVE